MTILEQASQLISSHGKKSIELGRMIGMQALHMVTQRHNTAKNIEYTPSAIDDKNNYKHSKR